MLKLIILLNVLITSSFGMTISISEDNSKMEFSQDAAELAEDLETPYLRINVETVSFPKGKQRDKLIKAFALTEVVLNSQEFKEKVIAYVAKSTGRREYTGNNGLSNEEVLLHLLEGRELTMKDTVGEMNLHIKKYNRWWSKVIAWTNPRTDKKIHVNWRFYKKFNVDQMVSNIVHEWVHLMGYFHVSKGDSDSVPYAVGRIAGEVAKNYLENPPTKEFQYLSKK